MTSGGWTPKTYKPGFVYPRAQGSITVPLNQWYNPHDPNWDHAYTTTNETFPGYQPNGAIAHILPATQQQACNQNPTETIVSPADGQIFKITDDPQHVTTTIPLQGNVLAGLANWTLTIEYTTAGDGKTAATTVPSEIRHVTTVNGGSINLDLTGVGGKVTILLECPHLSGESVCNTTRTVYIVGGRIPDSEITARLQALSTGPGIVTAGLLTGIGWTETDYRQFTSQANRAYGSSGLYIFSSNAASTLYGMNDSWPNEGRPWSAHAIGLMQVPLDVQTAWNWLANTSEARRILLVDKFDAVTRREFGTPTNQGMREKWDGLPLLTPKQREEMAVMLYGNHPSFSIDKQYYIPVCNNGSVILGMPIRCSGTWSFVKNTMNNPGGVAYVDKVYAEINKH
jgi:hypothetical protein